MKFWVIGSEEDNFASDRYLSANSCGFQFHQGHTILRKNGRSDYHILYIFSGSCVIHFAEKRYRISPGNFVLYYPHQMQRYDFADDTPCETFWLHFSGRAVPEILDELNLSAGVYTCAPNEKIISAFRHLIQEDQLRQPKYETEENALLLSLLTAISRHTNHHAITTDIEKVILTMHSDYAKPFTPKIYASICSLSVSRFSHKFKQVTGTSPLAFFSRIRCEKAKELLKYTDLNISEIAMNVGYDNPLYFSRIFHKFYSLSPSEYRKQQHEENAGDGVISR